MDARLRSVVRAQPSQSPVVRSGQGHLRQQQQGHEMSSEECMQETMGLVCGVSLDQGALVHHLQDEYDDGDKGLRESRRRAVAGEPIFTDSLEVVEDPVEGRYMVSLPWRGQERPKRNFGQACARAKALERSLSDDQNIKVQEELDSMLQKDQGY
ncbi:hypothetical protein Pmar_PMAR022144 [Perkinsus marinus ATCC 50983]|uniref:Uncharacterized protein n=1 Tax=Perkinsus marinus (strain ATCC 50983 / TXsc) TaxID=423536 RepID=C5L0Q5_PERM5|nr:hypothetical protein Pmar_PMAR022144 [Perkinsus marinus ATCC 50983]EER09707.1 hypothetical protein Pmar_PMAR022144 [Perkinsus marinus ATCC 50983]|eukprot:XP_002777912.1 hypothetical protein Pmar_PMAR022144 [Perkinsus marinus ATCC 50983]